MGIQTCRIGLILGLSLSGTLTHAATVFTGDKVQGVPVVSALTAGLHRFMFEGVETGTGQRWYVSVMVAKGKTDEKKVLLQASVHGDELNGVRIVRKTMEQLNPARMKGSVIGPNRSELERGSRTRIDYCRLYYQFGTC